MRHIRRAPLKLLMLAVVSEDARRAPCGKWKVLPPSSLVRPIAVAFLLAVTPSATTAQPWPVEFAARRCEFDRALALLEAFQAKDASIDQWEYGMLRARLLLQLERSKDAIAALGKLPAPKTKDQLAEFLFINGMALGLSKELLPALESLNKARAAGVDPSLIEGAVGMAYLAAGKGEEAERALLGALKSDPSLTGALYNLGCLRAGQGRLGEAAALVRQSWHFGLKDPLKLAADPGLAPLRSRSDLIGDLVASDERSCSTF